MVGQMDISRCECCGCERAGIASAYTVCSGVWTPVIDPTTLQVIALETSSSNAKIEFTPDITAPLPWRVRCRIEVFRASASNQFVARVHGGALGGCTDDGGYIEYGRDAGGHYYQLHAARQPYSTANCVNNNQDGGFGSSPGNQVALCWDGTTLSCQTPFGLLAHYEVPLPTGSVAALSTGVLGAGVTKVRFYDFHFEYGYSAGHENCSTCLVHPCYGPVPPELEFELNGFDPHTFNTGFPPYRVCDFNCSDLNGTFFLGKYYPFFGQGPPAADPCAGDVSAAWTKRTILHEVCTGPFGPTTEAYFLDVLAFLSAKTIASVIRRVIIVDVTTYRFGHIARFYGVTDDPCNAWGSWIDLTMDTFPPPKCSVGGMALARIRRA